MAVLDKIKSPADVKNLSKDEISTLADEIRNGILTRVNAVGGHLGPDLGIVEATIALHKVFNSPVDKFVFDVSHQCYPHKMLTGRKDGFTNPLEHHEISGYFAPQESAHDTFIIGHTSTSVSLATGLAKARDLKGENYNVIALIGDGSLSGGEAFEGMNNASVLGSNIIIIVNDNEMSIAENQGGLYKNLKLLRETNGTAELNYFKSFGFDYYYVENGNDVDALTDAFSKVKDTKKPTVVHIHTLKGKGFKPAEESKEWGHWTLPGLLEKQEPQPVSENYNTITTDYILKKQKEDIEELASMFKDMLGQTKEENSGDYIVKLESHYVKKEDLDAVYRFDIEGKSQALIAKIQAGELTCEYKAKEEADFEEADVSAKLSSEVMENILAGRSTFQGAFMTGDMTAKGNFKTLRTLDEIFIFE